VLATIAEIAEVKGLNIRSIQIRAKKEKWLHENGKNRAKRFVVAKLPEDVRAAIMSSQAEDVLPAIYNKEQSGEKTTDITLFSSDLALQEWQARPESCREEARKRLGLVNKARSIKARNKKTKTKALKRYAQSQGVSLPSLYKYLKDADKALKDAQSEGRDAIMAQILALTPDYGNNLGACHVFSREAIDYAKKLYASQAHLNLSDVYQNTVNEGLIQGWKLGSYDTLKRSINKEMDANLKTLARKGAKRYQADCELKILRDYREIWPNFMWCGDHHIFDVFVKAPGGKVLRPWLTAWMDMASRSFMGWCISFAPNSRTIALALAHGIARKEDKNFPQHGVPSSVYIDNGKDYRSKYLNGEEIKIGQIDYPEIIERFAALGIDPFYIDLTYDPHEKAWVKKRGRQNLTVRSIRVGGVYARLNIHQRYAIAYHPWSKPIERAFRNVVQQFSRQQPGWCGSGHEQRPEKLTWEIKRGLLLSYPEFCERFYQWVVNCYHKSPHTGHGMEGRSPDQAFLAFGVPELVDPEMLAFALLKKEQVKIHNWGFNLLGEKFELDVPPDLSGAAILNKTINHYATILYDPDYKTVRVYVDGVFMCMGRPLRRTSQIRPDDPVMQEKIKLQAYQRRLNKEAIEHIAKAGPPELGYQEAEALLALTTGGEERQQEAGKAPAVSHDPIPMTEEERYRLILRKEASGETLSGTDREWRDEYEQTDEYRNMRQLYEAELRYMKHQFAKEAV